MKGINDHRIFQNLCRTMLCTARDAHGIAGMYDGFFAFYTKFQRSLYNISNLIMGMSMRAHRRALGNLQLTGHELI